MWTDLRYVSTQSLANRKYSLPNHVLQGSGVKFEHPTLLKKIVVRSSWTQTRATAADTLGTAGALVVRRAARQPNRPSKPCYESDRLR